MSENLVHSLNASEWEWGWKTPLLLFPNREFASKPPLEPIRSFLETPLAQLNHPAAKSHFDKRIAELKSTRIGMRFERLQEALFSSHPDTESLKAGIVIPGKTEIDLLHRLRSLPNAVIHWEVAVKFYLCMDPSGASDADRWIGPGQKDSLGTKMNSIRNRQLTALDDPQVRTSLGLAPDLEAISIPKVQGVLFLPWERSDALPRESERPAGVTPRGERGYWFHESDSKAFLEWVHSKNGRCLILSDRKEWIRSHKTEDWSRPTPGRIEVPASGMDLNHYFNLRPKKPEDTPSSEKEPFQGCALFGTPTDRTELRFFCVPNSWRDCADGALESLKSKSRIKV